VCRETIPAPNVSKALFGLQRLGNTLEMRELISALTPKVEQCQEKLKAKEVSDSLYGLQSVGDSPESRRLVAALAKLVEESKAELNAEEIGCALFGLQSLGNSPETLQLVQAMTRKVKACRKKFLGYQIANALYGLQRLGDSKEALALLAALTPKLAHSDDLSEKSVGNSIFGLQNFSADSKEMCGMLVALTEKVSKCRENLSQPAFVKALHGLQRMGAGEEMSEVVQQLAVATIKKIERSKLVEISAAMHEMEGNGDEPTFTFLFLARGLEHAFAETIHETGDSRQGQQENFSVMDVNTTWPPW
jgi:hypothetical protein